MRSPSRPVTTPLGSEFFFSPSWPERAPLLPDPALTSFLPTFPRVATVTESDMAIAMASVGGAGFLHYNMTQDEQVAHLKAVKAHRLGYVTRTEVRGPDATLAECDALATSRGFTSVVVTDTGIIGGKLLGLVSSATATS